MPDYTDHSDVVKLLGMAQDAEVDNRQRVRECHLFLDKRDGQWEAEYWKAASDKPRYTFDMTNPIVDQIAGEIQQADFSIKVDPSSSDASDSIAETIDGLVRNIQNISNATHIYNQSARMMVSGGMDGWQVVQKYQNADSFEQDIMIEPIHNFCDRVWFDHAAEMQDMSDARHVFKLTAMAKDVFEEKYDRTGVSLSEDKTFTAYKDQKEVVVVGEVYYIERKEREIVLMSNGRVFRVDDDYKKVQKEMSQAGVKEIKRRSRPETVVCVRQFDANNWLNDKKETVFQLLPIIPTFGNFKIFENKVIYWGAVDKLIDPQRVMNYSISREIEEGALSPRTKFWMTAEQAAGHSEQLSTMNTNSDPVQFYNHIADQPQPYESGGAKINPGLRTISESMRQMLGQTAGLFAANMGDNPGLQSGVAIEKLQNKGDTGTIKYFSAQECAIERTAKVIIDAIPRVYDTQRMVRIVGEDGASEMVTLYERVQDQQTGEMVVLNDLSQGTYDVTCSAGASFQNRQQETVSAITEIGQVDPSFVELGGDILANNITAPGMRDIAGRKRQVLFNQGAIPFDQQTEQEQQETMAAQQQPPQQDPMMVAAEAELIKAQNEQQETQIGVEEKSANIQLKARELALKESQFEHSRNMDMVKAQKTATEAEKTAAEAQGQMIENQISIEEMRNMPFEKLVRVANVRRR